MTRTFRLALFMTCLASAGCGVVGKADTDKVEVVASHYPLAYLAEQVGGDLVEVINLTPPGAEPHDIELTPGQVRSISEADLVVYLEGFQPSVEDALDDATGKVLNALAGQEGLLPGEAHDGEEGEETHEEEESFDPHIWLAPDRVTKVAAAIASLLGDVDPENAAAYEKNLSLFNTKLEALDRDFEAGLAKCERRELVTAHGAFAYLAEQYGLEQVGIAGIDPEGEPTPQRLAEVAEYVRQKSVKMIYFESLLPRDLADTLAKEVGVSTSMLDPLEGPPESGDYLTSMRENLAALKAGLGCG